MRTLICAVGLIALAASITAEDVTGRWSGKNTFTRDGEKQENYSYAVLKQKGDELTGTIGPDADHQWPITKAKLAATKDGQVVTFTVAHTTSNGSFSFTVAYDLRLLNGHLVGHAKTTADGTTVDSDVNFERVK